MKNYRKESDFLGERNIFNDTYYGINAVRGNENFNINEERIDTLLIKTFAWTKKACLLANIECKSINSEISNALLDACEKIIGGDFDDQFIVNPIQGGGGTSFNMNFNEVIANIALEQLGLNKGAYHIISPLTHVNMSQSTNDVFPTSINLALIIKINLLLDILHGLKATLH